MSEMENWRRVFREGFAPLLTRSQLEALRDAIRNDDRRLIQGATTSPPPLMAVADWPVEGACLLGHCGVTECGGFGVAKVGQVEEVFARLCFEADRRLGEPAACRFLLNSFDNWNRDEMRHLMLPEVELALAGRPEEDAQ